MSEWIYKKIKDFAFTVSGGTPTTGIKEFWHDGTVPWINSGELSKNNIISRPTTYITELALLNSSAKLMPIGTVVIALTGATTGMSAILEIETSGNQSITGIFPSKEHNSKFLLYLLQYNIDKILNYNIGSAQPHINKEIVDNLKFLYPPILEQLNIAKILSICDSVIEKTEAAIEKYKAIKQGMLQDLFTRGLDLKTGKLRPKYEEAPELYKESRLGIIPREWAIVKLGNIGEFKNGVNKNKASFGHGTLFVNIINAFVEILDCTSFNRVLITDKEKQDYGLTKGDIIFVRSSVKPEGVGYNTMFIQYAEEVVYCGFMIRFRLSDKSFYLPEFYNSYFRFREFRNRLIASSTVSANTNINQVALSNLLAIKPNIKEQLAMVERMKAINKKLLCEHNYLSKLQKIKQGLMSDLLSGRKRVKVKEEKLSIQ